jgi:hypothetical protein
MLSGNPSSECSYVDKQCVESWESIINAENMWLNMTSL